MVSPDAGLVRIRPLENVENVKFLTDNAYVIQYLTEVFTSFRMGAIIS